ncbi:MAG: ATP-binding protein [Flavobacteriaceae bacterium]|nr:ATP-binding protein [Flavobacteriaceae bacterium]
MKDRGKAEFFRGRQEQLEAFNKLVERAEKEKSGTIFLVQGAPGVGKTAFLEECEEKMDKETWDVIWCDPDVLWDVNQLRKSLRLGNQVQIAKSFIELGVESLIKIGVYFKLADRTIIGSINNRRKKRGLLLILDEIQDLGEKASPPDKVAERRVRNTLYQMHNWKMKKPFILLVGGLGMSKSVLKQYGISRFNRKCAFNLGALNKEAEKEIIKQYMTKKGGVHENNPNLHHWIHTIVTETQGWAHHITGYGIVLSEQLKENQGVLNEKELEQVLKKGEEERFSYYEQRVEDIDIQKRKLITSLLKKKIPEMSEDDMVSFFKKTFDYEKSKDLFDVALEKGVFHQNEDGAFVVPIPSMQTWMLHRFGRQGKDDDPTKN